jgi:hypothetical protein
VWAAGVPAVAEPPQDWQVGRLRAVRLLHRIGRGDEIAGDGISVGVAWVLSCS